MERGDRGGAVSTPLVAHVIYALSTGGLENGLVNIINRCPPQRYRHAVICLTGADEFAARITAPGVEVFELRKREGHDFAAYRRLRRLLRELHPAIVHSRNMAALEAQLCTVGLKGLKRVHGEHGREVGDLDGSNPRYLMLRRFMRLFIHRYITVSQDLERWLVDTVGARPQSVTQVYNGVDHERFNPANVKPLALLPPPWRGQDDTVVIGTVGRLTPVKDQQLLLEGLALLRKEHPALGVRARLVVVGDGPLRETLANRASELGLDEAVWFTGDRSDVPDLLRIMDVFVLPSLGEGISNTVLEAMASGLPVLASAVGGNVELVTPGDTGDLFPVGDTAAFVQSLVPLLQDAGERRRQGDNARQRVVQRHNWDNTVAQYLAAYDELLAN
ncbi:MAG: TIGR03088 family PEP-CTERM/XrtA system glycosyltransferase [Halioglobus sp.]|nr:TIGR03088 family PEP-CTERM/XrtA system glycosyltransferase [Halioglobus sp.]